jgi:hypothetical protein
MPVKHFIGEEPNSASRPDSTTVLSTAGRVKGFLPSHIRNRIWKAFQFNASVAFPIKFPTFAHFKSAS